MFLRYLVHCRRLRSLCRQTFFTPIQQPPFPADDRLVTRKRKLGRSPGVTSEGESGRAAGCCEEPGRVTQNQSQPHEHTRGLQTFQRQSWECRERFSVLAVKCHCSPSLAELCVSTKVTCGHDYLIFHKSKIQLILLSVWSPVKFSFCDGGLK